MATGEFKAIRDTLKSVLKNRGITYRTLAHELGMSEAGIKRLLNADDCPMSRLLSICRVAGISLSELVQASDKAVTHDVRLTPAQHRFLTEHPHYFRYYCKLAAEDCSPEEIEKECGLDARSTMKYLRKLDQLELIQLLPGGKVKTGLPSLVSLSSTGDLFTREKYHSLEDLFKWMRRHERQGHNTLPLYFLELHPSTIKELRAELESLVQRYGQKSLREEALHKRENLTKLSFFFGLAERGFVGPIPRI